jgi:Zn-dependent metalloprotease
MKNKSPQLDERVRGSSRRKVYNADYKSSLPGDLVREEGQPPVSDMAVNEAYDHLGSTYLFFWDNYGRDSIDDKGMPLNATVHYQKNYTNAFWNGKELVIGDGDGELFNRFSFGVDIVANQLVHGIIQFECPLQYWGQAGALIESISDVFGLMVKQYSLHQTADQADWLIGQGLFTSNVNGVALRSMKAPGTAYNDPVLGKDPQPAHMRDYVQTESDNGGIHINSGIPNHAFYLIAMELGGHAWEKAGRIWYFTLINKLSKSSNLQDFANSTHQTAGELFGVDSMEQQVVKKGWAEVGINVKKTRKGWSLFNSNKR